MRKCALFLLLLAPLIVKSSISYASQSIANLDTLTQVSEAVIYGKVVSAASDTKEIGGKPREVIIYEFLADEDGVVKNTTGQEVKPGQIFRFNTFAPKVLLPDQEYMLFLKRYSFGVWAFVFGGQGIMRLEKDDDGEYIGVNKTQNWRLMRGVKKTVAGSKAKDLGLKSLNKKEESTLRHIRGPIKINEMIPLIQRIDTVNMRKSVQPKKIENRVSQEEMERTRELLMKKEAPATRESGEGDE